MVFEVSLSFSKSSPKVATTIDEVQEVVTSMLVARVLTPVLIFLLVLEYLELEVRASSSWRALLNQHLPVRFPKLANAPSNLVQCVPFKLHRTRVENRLRLLTQVNLATNCTLSQRLCCCATLIPSFVGGGYSG